MATPKIVGTGLFSEVVGVINDQATDLGITVRSQKGRQIIIDCEEDRIETQDELEMHIENQIQNKARISRLIKKDSIAWTEINGIYGGWAGDKLFLIYKNRSGGMAETTLNSSITELFPAIAWDQSISSRLGVPKFYNEIAHADVGTGGVYKNRTALLAGRRTINEATNSTKFVPKVEAAQGIYKWIIRENKRRAIKDVVWGYRNNTKPNGVNPNHKGDIFLVFQRKIKGDPDIMGVSIKAGPVGTKPPQFNSYVRAIFNSKAFGKLGEYNKLMRQSYDAIYKGIPDIGKFSDYGKPKMTGAVAKFESSNKDQYNALYDAQLSWLRDVVINLINTNQAKAKQWILNEVVKEQQSVPLVVIQSSGSNIGDVHHVTDEDEVKNCVSVSKEGGIHAYKAKDGDKQGWHINVTCELVTTTLNFSIRTNKSGSGHKLGQYTNLAVKFNGIA